MPVSPPDDSLRAALLDLRANNPSLGISKLHTKLLAEHPDWTVSEKRVKKFLPRSSPPGPQSRPTSRVINNLNVTRWTNKVKVVDYGNPKGKGLEAIAEIKVRASSKFICLICLIYGACPCNLRKGRMFGKRTRSSSAPVGENNLNLTCIYVHIFTSHQGNL